MSSSTLYFPTSVIFINLNNYDNCLTNPFNSIYNEEKRRSNYLGQKCNINLVLKVEAFFLILIFLVLQSTT